MSKANTVTVAEESGRPLFYEDITPGTHFKDAVSFTVGDLQKFAELTGDTSLLHSKRRIVPGMLIASRAATVLTRFLRTDQVKTARDAPFISTLEKVCFLGTMRVNVTGESTVTYYVFVRHVRSANNRAGEIVFHIQAKDAKENDLVSGTCRVLVPYRSQRHT